MVKALMMLVNAYPHSQTYQSQEILHKFRNKVTVMEIHAKCEMSSMPLIHQIKA